MLQEVFKDTVFVWRKEIKYLPFFGWALASIPMIETDRTASRSSLKRWSSRAATGSPTATP
jgi:1-acyl-sn-glycerol-3-phosphate acyltransferase